MSEIKYKVMAPLGSIVVPKEKMTEKEMRDFASQINQSEAAEIWREKCEKDSIKEVVDWLNQIGYQVEEIN